MSSGSKQLIEDYEQVQKLLATYPDIKIINTEGDPPEKYDIQYTIKGYKIGPDGSPVPDNIHQVSITLPFGYPHFPPTAKPISPIFHPDIDPDAIRIADFWQGNNSLPELIIHIGQMICGNHYTEEEPFNQSAYEWFQERSSWLPFDVLESREEDEPVEHAETEPEPESKSESFEEPTDLDSAMDQVLSSAPDLDILKDDIEFPFDEEDDEDIAETTEPFDLAAIEEQMGVDIFDLEQEEDISDETSIDIAEEVEASDEEPEEEFSLDFDEAQEVSEPFDLAEVEEQIDEDIFGLEPEDESTDEVSFEVTDEAQIPEEEPSSGELDDLFQLDAEPANDSELEETALEFDSEDFTTAFEEEPEMAEEGIDAEISLDDLAGLDEEEGEETLDFGLAEESMDFGGDATADLSGLEEEPIETIAEDEAETAPEETAEAEDKILAALSLDEDFSSPGRAEEQSEVIRSLIDQKQIYSAKKVLADLVEPDALSDKQDLELSISGAITEAEDLYKKADQHEKKGEFEKAGILLDLVANIAADFPGLEFSRNRIRESMMAGDQKKPEAKAEEKKQDTFIGDEKETAPSKPDKKKKKARAKISFKIPAKVLVILLMVLILAGIGAGVAYVYTNDSKNIKLAKATFQKAEQLVNRKEFKEAQKELTKTNSTLEKLYFFHGDAKEATSRKIKGLANSSVLKEGLRGRVLYGDQYYTVEVAKAIDKFNTQKSYAEQVLKSGKIDAAIAAYEKSLPYAEKAEFADQIQSIQRRIVELRFESSLSKAMEKYEKQDWLAAATAFKSALEFSKTIATQEEKQDIINKMDLASYRHKMEEGSLAINDSQWKKAIDAFQAIKKLLAENPHIVSEQERIENDKLLVQAQLYLNLAEAKSAYDTKQWQEAINTYQKTIGLLDENRGLLGEIASENIKKINKTILTTNLAREQVMVAQTRAANELEKTVEHYTTIANLIENSSFQDDETLRQILTDAKLKTTEIKNQLLISQREKWLTDNYDQIFKENYPSAKLSELMNPKVHFVKREDNLMIFNLSCTERKQGRIFRLELYYQNDLKTDKWSLYTGKIEEE